MKELEIKAPIIRPMEREDATKASELESKSFSMPWRADDFIEMIEAPYAYYYVAELEDSIVGVCGLRDISGEGEITNVVVDASFRGHGIGDMLIKTALNKCKELNIKEATLEVRVSNEAAIHLYEVNGFVSEGVRPRFYEKPVEDALIMWNRNL